MAPNPPGEYPRRWYRTPREYRKWDRAWASDTRTKNRPRILAEGDSWFSYPRKLVAAGGPSNIMQHLASRHRRLILLFSESGDELGKMLSENNQKRLLNALADFEFDLFLFSAGGNDFVGEGTFEQYLKPGKPHSAASWINKDAAGGLFDGLRDDFAAFVVKALQASKNPKTRMLIHTYDEVYPRNKGARFLGMKFGPWLWPDLEKMEVPLEHRHAVANWFLNEWAKRLKQVRAGLPAELKPRFKVIDTRGTLSGIEDWKDEIHPNPKGFKKLAQRFREAEPKFLD